MLSGRGRFSGRGRDATVPDAEWAGYVKNAGTFTGKRAICDARGTVLADFRTSVLAARYRASAAAGDEFMLWQTSVHTVDGTERASEEWSRDELGAFGALAGDGSYSIGPPICRGERFTVEQCVRDGALRVRTIHAYDWEGLLCGVTASRERATDAPPPPSPQTDGDSAAALSPPPPPPPPPPSHGIEPAAWRSPSVLLDYMLGEWEGRGVLLDRASGAATTVSSDLSLRQGDSLAVHQASGLRLDGGAAGARVRSRARLDGNVLFFPESRVQLILLPGGVSAAAPLRVKDGAPFVVETAFLVRPDFRRRVVRTYSADAEWINTVFLTERRVG